MNNFFGYKNEESEDLYGSNYLDRKISDETIKLIDEKQNEAYHYNKKTSLSSPLVLIMYVAFGYAILVIISFIARLGKVSFSEVIVEQKNDLITGGISLVVAVLILVISVIKKKKGATKEETDALAKGFDELEAVCKQELNVPKDAPEINILLSLDKKNRKGEITKTNYLPLTASIFFEDESICFAFTDTLYKVLKKEIVAINQYKRLSFVGWNKEEHPKNNDYKGYKVVVQSGIYYTTMTYSVIVDNGFNQLQIIVPCYDIQTLSHLLEMEIKEVE